MSQKETNVYLARSPCAGCRGSSARRNRRTLRSCPGPTLQQLTEWVAGGAGWVGGWVWGSCTSRGGGVVVPVFCPEGAWSYLQVLRSLHWSEPVNSTVDLGEGPTTAPPCAQGPHNTDSPHPGISSPERMSTASPDQGQDFPSSDREFEKIDSLGRQINTSVVILCGVSGAGPAAWTCPELLLHEQLLCAGSSTASERLTVHFTVNVIPSLNQGISAWDLAQAAPDGDSVYLTHK